jgi:hypothetical protein
MKRIRMMIGAFALCLAGTATAQNQSQEELKRLAELSQKLEGTYQVQVIDSREYFSMPLSMFDSIAVKRHESETRYLWLKPNTRIMIPPAATLRQADFKPLPRVAYITSTQK